MLVDNGGRGEGSLVRCVERFPSAWVRIDVQREKNLGYGSLRHAEESGSVEVV
jgi:hypothetical protein